MVEQNKRLDSADVAKATFTGAVIGGVFMAPHSAERTERDAQVLAERLKDIAQRRS